MRQAAGKRRKRTRRLAAATLLALGAPWTAPALASAPACLTSLALEPSSAYVDQQVLYRLRILSRQDVQAVEWLEPPAFPGLRAERLPGRPEAGRATRYGVEYRIREEHRALFPEHAGELAIGPARLRCRAAQEVLDTSVPAAALRVRELPAAGRPTHFGGLVGPVALSLRAFPRSLALGASVHVELGLQGGGNLWDAPDPRPDDMAFGDAEVFRQRPELELERGTSLFVRRRFAYDVVPHREGVLALPELRVAYFDPIAERYAEARVAGVEVAVGPRIARAETPAHPAQSGAAPLPPAASPRGPWPWIAIAAVAAALTAAAVLVARRRRLTSGRRRRGRARRGSRSRTRRPRRSQRGGPSARAARRPGRTPPQGGAPHARAAARRRLALRLATRGARAPGRVERARFDPAAPAPERARVEHAVARLRTHPGR